MYFWTVLLITSAADCESCENFLLSNSLLKNSTFTCSQIPFHHDLLDTAAGPVMTCIESATVYVKIWMVLSFCVLLRVLSTPKANWLRAHLFLKGNLQLAVDSSAGGEWPTHVPHACLRLTCHGLTGTELILVYTRSINVEGQVGN